MTNNTPLLDVRNLTVSVDIAGQEYRALDGISFGIGAGEAHGLVGESGSGKSLTLRSIMGLLPENARVTDGQIFFKGRDLLADNGSYLQQVRGTGITMIFQEPAVALNPVMRVGKQIYDSLAEHKKMKKKEARDYAIHLMELVGIVDPESRINAYPFELSGGLRQRVMIAAGVACGPELILCDEPTTALDVTVQEQILQLFAHLRNELNAGLLYVTHDLAVVAQLCDSVTVLYSGRIVESGDSLRAVFSNPHHPYTEALLRATPRMDGPIRRMESIPGNAPSLTDRLPGCPFYPRCSYATSECNLAPIPTSTVSEGWEIACLHPRGLSRGAVIEGVGDDD